MFLFLAAINWINAGMMKDMKKGYIIASDKTRIIC